MSDAKRIEQLRDELRRHDRLYYVEAVPEVSDREYDRLMVELRELEARHPELTSEDSPTQRVGGEPVESFPSVEHAVAMQSIDNTYDAQQVREFDARVRKALGEMPFHYLVDPKIDGLAMSLRYEKGLLVLAATRGDGRRGDDVTNNVRRIRSVPWRLTGAGIPDVVEVRGEVYWPRSAFASVNADRIKAGEEPFANPRNGAAGTLKSLDPRVVAARGLAFVAHGFGEFSRPVATLASETMNALAGWGIPANPHARVCDGVEAVLVFIREWLDLRGDVDCETDGMVVKIDELALREELGATSKYPRWCIAYKYEAEQARTVLRSVDFQVGRLGTITPVAHFDPVPLGGTTVSSASLHNFDQVARLDVRAGDTVVVEKAGEIIPQVVQVVYEKRPANAVSIIPPSRCPCRACGGEVAKGEGVSLHCVNPDCPAQLRERLIFFAGRDQMNMKHLGPALIDELVRTGRVKNFAGLYRLEISDLVGMKLTDRTPRKKKDGSEAKVPSVSPKHAEDLVTTIRNTRTRGLAALLNALGIPLVGARWAEVFAEKFGSMRALLDAPAEKIGEVFAAQYPKTVARAYDRLQDPEVQASLARTPDRAVTADMLGSLGVISSRTGRVERMACMYPTAAQLLKATREDLCEAFGLAVPDKRIPRSIYEFLHDKGNRAIIDELEAAGVDMNARLAVHRGADGPLVGKTVVLTGMLEGYSRKAAEDAVKAAGGKVASSVSGNTDFVVAGDDPGANKIDKARALGVEIIGKAELERRIG
ncbi:MAG: NAD-dependent DNA ligase LigA, partial [Planctomycetota bacterium]